VCVAMGYHVPGGERLSFPDNLGLRVVPVVGRSSFPDILGLLRVVPVGVPARRRSSFPDILGLRVVPGDGRLSFPDVLRIVPVVGLSSFPDILGLLRIVPGGGRFDHTPCFVPFFSVSDMTTLNRKRRRCNTKYTAAAIIPAGLSSQ